MQIKNSQVILAQVKPETSLWSINEQGVLWEYSVHWTRSRSQGMGMARNEIDGLSQQNNEDTTGLPEDPEDGRKHILEWCCLRGEQGPDMCVTAHNNHNDNNNNNSSNDINNRNDNNNNNWKGTSRRGQFQNYVPKAHVDSQELLSWMEQQAITLSLEASIFAVQDQAAKTKFPIHQTLKQP